MRFDNLARLGLQDIGPDAVQHTRCTLGERRTVLVAIQAYPTVSLDSANPMDNQSHYLRLQPLHRLA
jgi:hypothetical protein